MVPAQIDSEMGKVKEFRQIKLARKKIATD